MQLRVLLVGVACAAVLGACNSLEAVQFSPTPNQSAIVRDGIPAIVSRKASSIVMVSPAKHGEPSNGRLVFVVAVTNITKQPIDFHVAGIEAAQTTADDSTVPLQVIPYEQLVNEENARQVASRIFVGLAAGANAYSAAHAGYGTMSGNVYSPNGSATFTSTYHDPSAAAVAQANANAENEAMIADTIENGQRNLASLEHSVLKDNTVMPGEWVGGQVYIASPVPAGQLKHYTITIDFASDVHQIEVIQGSGT